MAQVSEVVLKYAARGAQAAQRADENVRDSIKRTGRTAREESGSVQQWMQRHKTALLAIGAATAGAMAMIIRASPDLSAQLASVRIAFSLFAMTLGSDVAPATEGIGTKLIDMADAFAKLDPRIRKPISAIVALVGGLAVLLPLIAGLQTLISGTVVASFLSWVASLVSLSSIMSAASAVLGVLTGAVTAVAAALGITVGAAAALIAIVVAVIAVIVAYIFNIHGARDAINQWAGDIVDFVKNTLQKYNEWRKGVLEKAREAVEGFLEWLGKLVTKGKSKAQALADRVGEKLTALADSASRWGKDMMDNFISGIRAKIDAARSAAQAASDAVKGYLSFDIVSNDRMAERWGSDLMQHFAKGVNRNASAISSAMPEQSPGGFGLSTSPSSSGAAPRSGGGTEIRFEQGAIVLRGTGNSRRDGQNIAEEASRGLADKFSRR